MPTQPLQIVPLLPWDPTEVLGYWRAAHPLHPLDLPMLIERLAGPPSPDPDLLLAARDGQGELVGLAAGVYPCRKEGIGGIRWIGALPGSRHEETIRGLLEALTSRLEARGAKELHLFATPPHYLRPGVDIRETGLIALFQQLGWHHSATHFNMTCDLRVWRSPGEGSIFGIDAAGYNVRRAAPADREPLRQLIEREWTPGWRDAATLAFGHDPITVFLAEKGEELVGFAAYEVDQCRGSFGPTGVAPSHQGNRLGARLLWACLDDLQKKGRAECQIGWVGPVGFYHRACNAVLGPTYWMMVKKVGE